jgi:hypothetical protein
VIHSNLIVDVLASLRRHYGEALEGSDTMVLE